MKIALIIVASLVVVIAAVVVIGALLPKQHVVSRSAIFRAPQPQLFALIAGAQNWRPDVLRYEAVADASSRELFSETTRNGETVLYEVVDRKPPNLLTRRIASKDLPYSGSWTYLLERRSDGTEVRITERGEVYNPLFRFMSRFVFGQSQGIENYLKALAQATGEKVEIQN